ncbi:MAG: cupin domain-containing protein [Actinomycetota bacterium]|nr:cupin domain-containing protein [Actinomycetota bacterium]
MADLESKNFDAPDETRTFDKGKMDLITLGETTIGRAVFEPVWKWSACLKPIVGTDSCQVAHTGYVVSGRMKVVMDSGPEGEAGPGDMFVIAPGHDAWIVGDEPCVVLDVEGAPHYAKQ